MLSIRVSELYIYPVKSLGGLAVDSLELDARGPIGDRRWMVVDESGQFVTQRQNSRMALIRPQFDGPRLSLLAPGQEMLTLAPAPSSTRTIDVTVWSDTCRAFDEGDEAAQWLSHFLGQSVRLVKLDDSFHRRIDEKYGVANAEVTFADLSPLMMISKASLDLLNSKLEEPMRMDRFRPNIVIEGTEPHAEDQWSQIRIGEVAIRLIKATTRCPITTVNQQTAEKGKEPLLTLAQYRRNEKNKIIFGQNLIHLNTGTLRIGDPVTIEAPVS